MKTLVLTAYDGCYAAIGVLTTPLMQAYADRHGYDYRCHRERPVDIKPMWWKLLLMREALTQYDRVFWLDADIVITNPEMSVDNYTHGIHLSQDWGRDAIDASYFSCGCYVACRDAIEVFHWAWYHANDYKDLPFGDQDALRDIFANHSFQKSFHIHPRRRFNAVPKVIHETVVEPWEMGDFAAHLTMIPMAERVALFHQIKELCNLST